MSLSKWAAKNDGGPADVARKALAKLTPSPTKPGRVLHPFPVGDREAYKQGRSQDEIKDAIASAPVKKVPIKSLTAIQKSVDPERVAAYIDHPEAVPKGARDLAHGGPIDKPIVVQCGGKSYLYDGHHRTTAAYLKGDKTIAARVANLGAPKKSDGEPMKKTG